MSNYFEMLFGFLFQDGVSKAIQWQSTLDFVDKVFNTQGSHLQFGNSKCMNMQFCVLIFLFLQESGVIPLPVFIPP